MNTKIAITVVIVAGLLIGTAIIVNKPEPVKVSQTMEDEFKSEFMGGCVGEGNYAYCNCAYEYLVNEIGFDGLVDESAKYLKTDKISPIMLEAASQCVYLIK